MKTQSASPMRVAQSRPSPIETWQALLTNLLDQHYGLTLNDTPLCNDGVIKEYINAGISLCDAVNFIVEKYDLVRIDRRGLSVAKQSSLISSIDILRARRATGMMKRSDYRAITDITTGKYSQESGQ